jgi:hypothetical protein
LRQSGILASRLEDVENKMKRERTSAIGSNKAARPHLVNCRVQTYRFKNGQVVTAGVVKFAQLENLSIPIIGGSGAYRSASGFVSAGKPVKGFLSVDVLHLRQLRRWRHQARTPLCSRFPQSCACSLPAQKQSRRPDHGR